MLGGEVRETPDAALEELAAGMRAGPTVRGALAGRNMTFAAREDPRAIAAAAAAIVHEGAGRADGGVKAARAASERERGRGLDLISSLGEPPAWMPVAST